MTFLLKSSLNFSFKQSLLGLALLSTLPLTAHAHRQWILPSSTLIESRDPWVTIDAATSENLFDIDTLGQKLDGLLIIAPNGTALKPENQFLGKQRSTFDLKLATPGTYKISLVNTNVMASYKLNGEQKRFRGSEASLKTEIPANAEELIISRTESRQDTFVSAGLPGKLDSAVFTPTGKGIELQPLTHPNELRAGESAKLRLLIDGKPAANLAFGLIPGGVRYRGLLNEVRLTTDAKGEATFTLPNAGMYWLNASYPQRTAAAMGQAPADAPARRLSYSATLEVLPQ